MDFSVHSDSIPMNSALLFIMFSISPFCMIFKGEFSFSKAPHSGDFLPHVKTGKKMFMRAKRNQNIPIQI